MGAKSRAGRKLQEKIDAEDRLRERKVPKGQMGSAFGYNRPPSRRLVDRVRDALKEAREQQKLRRNPPPRLEGAVDISDIDSRTPKRRKTI